LCQLSRSDADGNWSSRPPWRDGITLPTGCAVASADSKIVMVGYPALKRWAGLSCGRPALRDSGSSSGDLDRGVIFTFCSASGASALRHARAKRRSFEYLGAGSAILYRPAAGLARRCCGIRAQSGGSSQLATLVGCFGRGVEGAAFWPSRKLFRNLSQRLEAADKMGASLAGLKPSASTLRKADPSRAEVRSGWQK